MANRAKTRGFRRLRAQQGKERLSHKYRRCLPCLTASCPGISQEDSTTSWSNCLSRSDEGVGSTGRLEIQRTRKESAHRRPVPVHDTRGCPLGGAKETAHSVS